MRRGFASRPGTSCWCVLGILANARAFGIWAFCSASPRCATEALALSSSVLRRIPPSATSSCRWMSLPSAPPSVTGRSLRSQAVRRSHQLVCDARPCEVRSSPPVVRFGVHRPGDAVLRSFVSHRSGLLRHSETTSVRAPKLLGELDLEGVLIQADALHTQRRFSQLKEQGADFLLTVKANQKTLYRQIANQLLENARSLSSQLITNRPRARHHLESPGQRGTRHIKENWHGTSWIAEVIAQACAMASRLKPPIVHHEPAHHPRALLRLVRERWSLESWHWIRTPSSAKTHTVTAETAPVSWPHCEPQP